ncbi:MAG: NAD(P)H-binding protein [Segetibacter sp.]
MGATGPIGTETAKQLINYTDKIRLVSRNPKKVNVTDTVLSADLTNAEDVDKAIAGSQIVYLTIGFEYKTAIWKKTWPALMENVIAACKKYNSKLVLFDNVYMYDRNFLSNMTEETPVRPTSKKGAIRAEIAERLLDETRKGNLTALIARSADFFGPSTVYKNFKKGKKANWFADVNKVHNFTFYTDAAKGTAILGNTPEAYNQVWHLPTDNTHITGKQWIELFARQMDVKPSYMVVPEWLAGIMGIFVPMLKELKEMIYQYDRNYFFNSSKFDKAFNYKPLTPDEAVKTMVKS